VELTFGEFPSQCGHGSIRVFGEATAENSERPINAKCRPAIGGPRSEEIMSLCQREFLFLISLAAAAAMAGFGQTEASEIESARRDPQSASIPDFSGIWAHPYLPGFEPPASGPGPILNRSRSPNGRSNFNQLVGDYTNPILRPEAGEIVQRHGEMSLAGLGYPTPSNQ
jgi:hypothetical protein